MPANFCRLHKQNDTDRFAMNSPVQIGRSGDNCDVAIVGAGPYGLAVAAHLRAANVSIRVFGEALAFWRRNMPEGMKLRSPSIATHIADPLSRYRLDDYFTAAGLPRPEQLPVERFVDYGTWFQNHVAPDLDTRAVAQVEALDDGFHLLLDDGRSLFAKRVVVATGLFNHEHRPAQFDGLPRALISHSCEHTDSTRFRGRHVAVIGGGQSACELAALLHEAGANVEIFCRRGLVWNADPDRRSTLRKTVRAMLGDALVPPSQVGPFPFNWLVEAPGIIHYFPEQPRDRLNTRCLRATAALWLRCRLQNVPVNEGCGILDARRDGDRVALTLDSSTRDFDHVLLATGYRIDVDKMKMLEPRLRNRVARHSGLPILSGGFESSVSGLHFVGAFAVASFGPLLRFIAGTGFAARRITRSVIGHSRASRVLANASLDSFRQEAPLPLAAERD